MGPEVVLTGFTVHSIQLESLLWAQVMTHLKEPPASNSLNTDFGNFNQEVWCEVELNKNKLPRNDLSTNNQTKQYIMIKYPMPMLWALKISLFLIKKCFLISCVHDYNFDQENLLC